MYEWKKLNCNKNGRENERFSLKTGKVERDRKKTRKGREG